MIARVERVLQPARERVDREDVGDRSQRRRHPGGRVPDVGDERDRKHDQVDDHGAGFGLGDELCHPDPDRGERGRAEQQRDHQAGKRADGQVDSPDQDPTGDRDDRERRSDQAGRPDPRGRIGPARQRRTLHPLEHAGVAQDRRGHRHVRECGHDHAVGEDSRNQEVVVRDPAQRRDVAVLVQRREDHQEHQREREREHAAAAVAPVRALLVADLPADEAEIPAQRRAVSWNRQGAHAIASSSAGRPAATPVNSR